MSSLEKYNWSTLERREMAIFPVVLLMHAYTSRMESVVGVNHRHFIMRYESGMLHALRDEDDWNHVSEAVLEYIMQNPHVLNDIHSSFTQNSKVLKEQARRLGGCIRCVDDAIVLFKHYCQWYTNVAVYGECIPYTIKELLAHKLEGDLEECRDADSIRAPFCQPEGLSFTQREARDFLLRLQRIQKDPAFHAVAVKEHWDEYAWMSYDYDGHEWATEDLECRFIEAGSLGLNDIEDKLKEIEDDVLSRKEQIQVVRQNRSISQETKDYLNVLHWSVTMMDLKKEAFTRVHYATKPFFEWLAEYLGVERKHTSYLLPYELKAVVENGPEVLRKRWERSSVYVSNEGCVVIDDDRDYRVQVAGRVSRVKEVRGLCACPGKVSGRVRVVRTPQDLSSFEEGEVLVATMTTMSFLEAMKKAAAIITDDGGIICHAAIVSREINTPTVVGTRHATELYANGDIVTVHATKGIVRGGVA